MKSKKLVLSIVAFLISFVGFSQNPNTPEMADLMRDNGKIYVVVGVLLILLVGFFTYLIMVDRKISKLEKELKSK